ncbi:MAG: ABC transporter ATP-binding protein, partial [Candidatus Methanomethylophilaceae archaeon]|nr:ABC transporter ATP-binding protein [Candidatus Methanomethylophilaceae archaeon]
MPSIDVRSMSFGYGKEPVLRDINVCIEGAGLTCIIGPNGVGKSTLVKCMNGLLKPTSGEVLVDGRPVKDYTVKEISRLIGYVPASAQPSFPMSVVDSILIGRDSKSKWRIDPEDVAAAYRALRTMRMEGMALRGIGELSAGQMQKANLCRGLVREAEILILDEPTANLDVKHQLFVTNFLQVLARETGARVVMISHDLNIAARFADEVLVLREPGEVEAYGPPAEVVTEEMIRKVYSVRSKVVDMEGRPHVIP